MTSRAPHRHTKLRSALLGGILGLGAPLGWLFYRAIATHPDWLGGELAAFGPMYLYMTVATVSAFSAFGYVMGRREDASAGETEEVKEELQEVNEMAFTDALTGLKNARYLHDQLAVQLDSARRYKYPVACLMMDIDGFKKINDTHGHPFGDAVLATMGKTISGCVRTVDIAGRLGGEEFMVIMPHTSSESARPIAERIRTAMENTRFSTMGSDVPITVSVGIASFLSGSVKDKGGLLKAADEAMYAAKRAGKNRTVVHEASSAPTT